MICSHIVILCVKFLQLTEWELKQKFLFFKVHRISLMQHSHTVMRQSRPFFFFFPASLSLFLPQQRITAAEFDKGRRLLQQCIAGVRLHFVAIIPAPVVCSIEKNKLNYTSYKEEKQLKKKNMSHLLFLLDILETL